jgi:hypothetical protein
MAQGTPASAACVVLAGTADGFDKETAVSRAPIHASAEFHNRDTGNFLTSKGS